MKKNKGLVKVCVSALAFMGVSASMAYAQDKTDDDKLTQPQKPQVLKTQPVIKAQDQIQLPQRPQVVTNPAIKELDLQDRLKVRPGLFQDEPVRVIAVYNQKALTGQGSERAIADMKSMSASAQLSATQQIRSAIADRGFERFSPIQGVPIATVETTRSRLAELEATNQFALIVEDKLSAPTLDTSTPVIGVDDAHTRGARGAGTTVAILDTGVDDTHPFLAGRVVEGACYSSNVSSQGATSLCPSGATSATTVASARPCTGASGCDHGTHVAGIAAGRAFGSTSFDGVAPDANIMAVQVFSLITDSTTPGGPTNCANFGRPSPCVLSYDSDQIRGLARVNARADALNIVAANMSLGGGGNTGFCNSDARKPAIDQLLTNGVATVISSGNSSFRNQVGAPGCISTAITVGSTTDADAVSNFSNMSNTVDLLAPGSSIRSSVPGTGFGFKNGTSMAAPQVAGAIAALSALSPDSDINTIIDTLRTTGDPVTDGRTGGTVTRPRIDLDEASEELAPRQDCIGHDLSNLRLVNRGGTGGWTITDGRSLMFAFGNKRAEAEQALAIIRRHGFTRTCYIGRPNASMQYLVAGSSVSSLPTSGEDCIGFNRSGVRVEAAGSQWRLTDGRSSMVMFPNRSEADQAVAAIQRYNLNRQCFVGRPGASFTYWLAQ